MSIGSSRFAWEPILCAPRPAELSIHSTLSVERIPPAVQGKEGGGLSGSCDGQFPSDGALRGPYAWRIIHLSS